MGTLSDENNAVIGQGLCTGTGSTQDRTPSGGKVESADETVCADDTNMFFAALTPGNFVLLFDPSTVSVFPDYKRLIGFLSSLGVKAVFDVSFGAELAALSIIKHGEKHNPHLLINSSCQAIVEYCEQYRPELLPYLAPVQSPVQHTALMIREFFPEYNECALAALSPCAAMERDFRKFGLITYNLTLSGLAQYLEEFDIDLDDFEECSFTGPAAERGVAYAEPDGMNKLLQRELPSFAPVGAVEGDGAYEYLDRLPDALAGNSAPLFVDCRHCSGGCTRGYTGAAAVVSHTDSEEHPIRQREHRHIEAFKDNIAQTLEAYWKEGLYERTFTAMDDTATIASESEIPPLDTEIYDAPPEMAVTQAESVVYEPEMPLSDTEIYDATPEMAVEQAENIVSEPEITLSDTKTYAAAPEMAVEQAESAVPEPEMPLSDTEIYAAAPEITVEQAENIVSESEIPPLDTEIYAAPPEMAVEQAESVLPEPEISLSDSEICDAAPAMAVEQAENIVFEPEISLSDTEICDAAPEMAVEQTDSVVFEPEISLSDTEIYDAPPEMAVEQAENIVSEPEISLPDSEICDAAPAMAVEQTDTVVFEPQMSISDTEIGVIEPELAVEQTESAVPEPEISLSDTEICAAPPEMAVEQAENIVSEPEISLPDSEICAAPLEIAVEQAENAVPEPEISLSDTEICAAAPEIAAEQAENAVSEPEMPFPDTEIYDAAPEMAVEQAESAVPEPEIPLSDTEICDTAPEMAVEQAENIVLKGVSFERTLARFGNEETYISIIKSYITHTNQLLEQTRHISRENINDYAIIIHGIKSSSRAIGADFVGLLAEELEYAAAKRRLGFCRVGNLLFQQEAARLIAELSSFVAQRPQSAAKPEKDAPDAALLERLKTACDCYDITGVDEVMAQLEKYSYLRDDDKIKQLREYINNSDFSMVQSLL